MGAACARSVVARIERGDVGRVSRCRSGIVRIFLRRNETLEIRQRIRGDEVLPGEQTTNPVFAQIIGAAPTRSARTSVLPWRRLTPQHCDLDVWHRVAIFIDHPAR